MTQEGFIVQLRQMGMEIVHCVILLDAYSYFNKEESQLQNNYRQPLADLRQGKAEIHGNSIELRCNFLTVVKQSVQFQ